MTEPVTVGTLLEGEHQWIDGRFGQFLQALNAGSVNAEPLDEAAHVLHRHIFLEEEILFPELEARGVVGPTAVMVQEHGQICDFLERIAMLIRDGAPPDRIQQVFDALRSLLEEHNAKEEQVLYPAADHLLNSAELLRRMQGADPPHGWLCRAHRGETG
ncbi:MAG: hemerythrin domain-containing protein [Chloroflexi bacterium]|nr:hemerythrin domain-containing protein [Chloroflexota bacterium]